MKFAIPLSMLPMEELLPLTLAAEEEGFNSVAVSDHLIHPATFSVPYPYTDDGRVRWEPGTDWPDPITTLSFLAGSTNEINFYTSVYVLPSRNPIRAAKEISTLSNLSKGRFSLGVGMGWMPEEFQAGEQPFSMRGKRADEMLKIMKLLWAGEMVHYAGDFFSFERLEMLPKPDYHLPIYVGGFSEPALERAAKYDGWISDMHSLDELADLIKKISKLRATVGNRNDYEIIAFSSWDAFSFDGFKKMEEIGVTTITTYPWMLYGITNEASLDKKIDGLKKFSRNIINKF